MAVNILDRNTPGMAAPAPGTLPQQLPTQAPAAPVPLPGHAVPAPPAVGDQIGSAPAQDPTYLAFLRASGASDAELKAGIAAKQAALLATYRAELPTYADQLRRQLGSDETSALDRGVYNSGMEPSVEATDKATNANDVNKLTVGLQNNQTDLEQQLSQGLAKSQESRAEAGLTARSNVATNSAAATTPNAPPPVA